MILLLKQSFTYLQHKFPACAMASSSKKMKLTNEGKSDEPKSDFIESIENDRISAGKSVTDFKYLKKRVRILSNELEMPEDAKGVVYWMSRDCRVQDNWAMLFAQKLALKTNVPLHVCFSLLPKFLDATMRHFDFLLKGLEEVSEECASLNINFHLLEGSAGEVLPAWAKEHRIGAVVCDFSPLRQPLSWVEDVKTKIPKDVPLIQVDAHNVVPCWIASPKLEYSARTIRTKINSKLDEYLTQFPRVMKHPYKSDFAPENIDWKKALETRDVDKSIGPCSWATPGTKQGLKTLEKFCTVGLKKFGTKRNDPLADALSNLSPWFHFGVYDRDNLCKKKGTIKHLHRLLYLQTSLSSTGCLYHAQSCRRQLSVQRAILCVQKYKSKHSESVSAFCEEAIVRRELADNFCYYNEHYDSLKGASNWAQTSLDLHRKDKREYLYSTEQLRDAMTHDDLWNSAQLQLVKEGKMHGFMRMYWAKKILEWTESPEQALKDAIYLNDRYGLDGRDPNGFVGCMWSICGIHDQGWAERAVFGKIRFMNYAGCKRKFDINAYIVRYGGKCHKSVKLANNIFVKKAKK